jgi:hypothetical protein
MSDGTDVYNVCKKNGTEWSRMDLEMRDWDWDDGAMILWAFIALGIA